jgi:hypothetical protein
MGGGGGGGTQEGNGSAISVLDKSERKIYPQICKTKTKKKRKKEKKKEEEEENSISVSRKEVKGFGWVQFGLSDLGDGPPDGLKACRWRICLSCLIFVFS